MIDEINIQDILNDVSKKMDGAISSLKHLFSGLRTGRASVALLDSVKVEVYGSVLPINQVATITVPESRMIVVQVWDKGLVSAVEKAIIDENLGITPSKEGQNIRLQIPDLTEDRRKELVKKASEYTEQTKVSIRNIRRNANDSIKKHEKNKELSEDDARSYMDDVQQITDKYIKNSDDLLKKKNDDIMKI